MVKGFTFIVFECLRVSDGFGEEFIPAEVFIRPRSTLPLLHFIGNDFLDDNDLGFFIKLGKKLLSDDKPGSSPTCEVAQHSVEIVGLFKVEPLDVEVHHGLIVCVCVCVRECLFVADEKNLWEMCCAVKCSECVWFDAELCTKW